MAGPGSTFTGPLISGPKWYADTNGPANTGLPVLTQSQTITQNGTAAVSVSFALPPSSVLHDIQADTTTAWNSGTSDVLTVGTAAADATYAGGGGTPVSVQTAGRQISISANFATGAQLSAWQTVGTTVVATVTPAGTAATAGTTIITLEYIQTVENLDSLF